MELIILPKGAGKYDVTDKKDRVIYTVTKKRRLIGNPITTLFDASGYALYTMVRTQNGKKPAFQIIFNDNPFFVVECKSLYVDPCITFAGGNNNFELKGKNPYQLSLNLGKESVGTLITERQANDDPKYTLTVEDAYFDDYIPLFAVVADKCFSGKNK